MDKKAFLNEKYLNLCQQLGDAYVKLKQLNDHIESLEKSISSLNDAFPLIAELEAKQRASHAAAGKGGKDE